MFIRELGIPSDLAISKTSHIHDGAKCSGCNGNGMKTIKRQIPMEIIQKRFNAMPAEVKEPLSKRRIKRVIQRVELISTTEHQMVKDITSQE